MRVGPPAWRSGENRWTGTGLIGPGGQRIGGGGVLVEDGVTGPVLDGLAHEEDRAAVFVGALGHASSIDQWDGGSVTRWPTSGSKSRPTAS